MQMVNPRKVVEGTMREKLAQAENGRSVLLDTVKGVAI